jgi:dTDP-D-glucose 4,6-dehydratase
MNFLITGGAGFIGSNFVCHMVKKYPAYRIVNLDKLTYAGNLENLKEVEGLPNYTFIKGDIGDAGLLKDVFKEHRIDFTLIVRYSAPRSSWGQTSWGPSRFLRRPGASGKTRTGAPS